MRRIQPFPGMGGGRRRDTSTHPPWYPGGHTTRAYTRLPSSLGGPQHAHGRTGGSALCHRYTGGTVTGRVALSGDIPWVGASRVPPGL